MKMRNWLGIVLPAFFAILFFMYHFGKEPVKESIIFFPIDNQVYFTKANTSVRLSGSTPENYTLQWNVASETNQSVYLRQDISLLYGNGVLASTMNKWKQDTKIIEESKKVSGRNERLSQSVSFHYAEIHKNENTYRSAQAMSGQRMYVYQKGASFASFQKPQSQAERTAKTKLDVKTYSFLQKTWTGAKQFYNVTGANYYSVALTDLPQYQKNPLPGFTQEQTNKIIGNLWEGLYKNYFLGVKKSNGQKVSPIGSSMPLIMFSKDKTHLMVLFNLKDGEFIQLIQYTR
ncbi:hypothetical protein SAMN04488137_2053 [Fictibacillus solisalsi]|uniref:Uncharacterized protein n=1 Tax=Fictibacillus solisalsi TaxID=459525 RepID=A0A1G9WB74_9BACL|nr:hypothetical protein [Fictibacillus solisalsi]SDM81567.1 hypothetical protein SAMN04488137_2053 [Fictibacillus solisalsi]